MDIDKLQHTLDSLLARAERTDFQNEREVCLQKYEELTKKFAIELKENTVDAKKKKFLEKLKLFKSMFEMYCPEDCVPIQRFRYYSHIEWGLSNKLRRQEEFRLHNAASSTYHKLQRARDEAKKQASKKPECFWQYMFEYIPIDEFKDMWDTYIFNHVWHLDFEWDDSTSLLTPNEYTFEEVVPKLKELHKRLSEEFEEKMKHFEEVYGDTFYRYYHQTWEMDYIESYFDTLKLEDDKPNRPKPVSDGYSIANAFNKKPKEEKKKEKKKKATWNYMQQEGYKPMEYVGGKNAQESY